jgi:hypothetical protein
LEEQLSAPDAPGLTPLECSCEALGPNGAVQAQGLGQLDVGGRFGEEQVRVVHPARKQLFVDTFRVQNADAHVSPPSSLIDRGLLKISVRNTKAADPLVWDSAALEVPVDERGLM